MSKINNLAAQRTLLANAPKSPMTSRPSAWNGCAARTTKPSAAIIDIRMPDPTESGTFRGRLRRRGAHPHRSTAVTSPADARAWAEVAGTKLSGGAHWCRGPLTERSATPGGTPSGGGEPAAFSGLHGPAGSTGRLLQLAAPPHPCRVTPRGRKQQRIWDDLAVRSPDSSREILRATGVDQHLRTSAPCRTVRLPRHVPDLPTGELPLKLAPALTVPHGLSPPSTLNNTPISRP